MKVEKVEAHLKKVQIKNVAAYCRVSDENERLLHSLEAQTSYYDDMIPAHAEWNYVGAYCDEAITGTTDDRPAFQRMLHDCDIGKIDIILTKSISRFSRNTVDLLDTIRHLKRKGIEVRFEKEQINTLSEDGELMLTLLASFAQEESRSISENIKWGIRKNFEKGVGNNFHLYGYRWENKAYRVVEEEAEVVRRIFDNYLNGISAEKTAQMLNAEGIHGPGGGLFYALTIRRMLENERYTGNRLLQKEFIQDHKTHKRQKNKGELPRFYVEQVAPPIISQEVFDSVQTEIERRRKGGYLSIPGIQKNPFTKILICGECGVTFRKTSKAAKDGSRRSVAYMCRIKGMKGISACDNEQVPEQILIKCTNEVMERQSFDECQMREKIKKIIVKKGHLLIYEFYDGRCKTIVWHTGR